MSEENVELAKQAFRAWEQHGLNGVLAFVSEHVEYRPADEPPLHGREAVRGYHERWFEPWEDYGVGTTEFLDAGDKLVVGMFVKGRGKGSGVEVSLRYWNVFWVEEGKAVRWVEFLDREDALEAAGLPE
jgi:ketosteroid isomerase-like protein